MMKHCTWKAIVCSTTLMVPMAIAGDLGVMHFLNGDSLPGKLRTLDREMVEWESSVLAEPAAFMVEAIRDLRLPTVSAPLDRKAGHEATLTLTNGDTLRGQLASVGDDRIVLDTGFAGRMTFRRAMVRDLAIREMPEYLYRGPLPLDGWT